MAGEEEGPYMDAKGMAGEMGRVIGAGGVGRRNVLSIQGSEGTRRVAKTAGELWVCTGEN